MSKFKLTRAAVKSIHTHNLTFGGVMNQARNAEELDEKIRIHENWMRRKDYLVAKCKQYYFEESDANPQESIMLSTIYNDCLND